MAREITDSTLDGRRSTGELLKFYELMGIPHFQRGSVWDAAAVGLLLESLYYGTPCGAIILWVPKDVASHGIPLGEPPMRYLIIDGQQRIRSLQGVFGDNEENRPSSEGDDTEEGRSDANDEEDGAAGTWCLNLGRLPQFAASFEGGKRFQLFRRVKDPREQATESRQQGPCGALLQDQEALLPLKWFIENDEDAASRLIELTQHRAIAKAAKAVLENKSVNEKLRQIRTRQLFYVSVLGSQHSLQDVISTYNRINSAGKRVEAEEKAFANLVASYEGAGRSLKDFFERVARPPTDRASARLSRDGLLQREKESRFGFKLFMRTFVMGLAYHSNRAVGSANLSFDCADPETLGEAREHLPRILDSTVSILVEMATILRKKLQCDDFRMLPETASLWPLFQLLIRFPQLRSSSRDTLAAIAFRLMVAGLDKADLLTLCKQVNEIQSAKDALTVFDGKGLGPDAVGRAIKHGVREAQSLTDRYALVMYWLLRSRGAMDFSYDANVRDHAAELRRKYHTRHEPPLSESVQPQKQHIVPYKRLKGVFNLTGARPGRHPVHDIGNLTYISAGENSFETGVGSRPLKLNEELRRNLDAHLLADGALLNVFDDVCSTSEGSDVNSKKSETHYGKFCRMRREKIVEALIQWDTRLRSVASELTVDDSDLLPEVRLIAPQLDDRIRGLKYPPSVTDGLMRLYQLGMKETRKKDANLSIAYRRKGSGKQQRLRVDLHASGRALELKLSDSGLGEQFKIRYSKAQMKVTKGSLRCGLQTDSKAAADDAGEKLDWIARQLGPGDR